MTEEEIDKRQVQANSTYVVELSELIEQVITERPDKRKKELYKSWYKEVNELVDKCNKLAKYNIYGVIK